MSDRRTEKERKQDEEQEREQAREQQREQAKKGTQFSPPPYEVPETPLERLGPGLGYLAAVIGGGFLLNLLVIAVIAGMNGG